MSIHDLPASLIFDEGPTSYVVLTSALYEDWTLVRLSDSSKWIIVPLPNELLADPSVEYWPILVEAWTKTDWDTLPGAAPDNSQMRPWGGRYLLKE